MDTHKRASLIAEWKEAEHFAIIGWDTSALDYEVTEDPLPWSFETMVRQALVDTDSLLDLGTGGGERLLQYRDLWPSKVAVTEGYPPNIHLVKQRLLPLGVEVRHAHESIHDVLPYDDEEFSLVTCRHTAYNSSEVHRVLKRGGAFITQQGIAPSSPYPAEHDLSLVFRHEHLWPWHTFDFAVTTAKKAGLCVDEACQFTGKRYYQKVSCIVKELQVTPWSAGMDNFKVEPYLDVLFGLQQILEKEGCLWFFGSHMVMRTRRPVVAA